MKNRRLFIGIFLLLVVLAAGLFAHARLPVAHAAAGADGLPAVTPGLGILTTDTPRASVANQYAGAERDESGWWRAFRRESFVPADEPLFTAVFGTKPAYRAAGDYVYASYYSAAIGFATSLPAAAVVQYGETDAYELGVTAAADDYYFNHTHYIQGLQPGKAYHYRLVAMAHDGAAAVSEDRTFTTKTITSDVIRIPDDMPGGAPYLLDSEDTTYLLTRDISAGDTLLKVIADNVTVDLGGFTAVYDDADGPPKPATSYTDENGAYGIYANGDWGAPGLSIYNGTIMQGKRLSPFSCPVWTMHHSPEVAAVTFNYAGDDTVCFYNRDYFVTADRFRHNVVYDRGTYVTDRHTGIRVLYGGVFGDVSFNSVRRFRHMGITGGAVYENELYSDSYASNSFAVNPVDGGAVYDNKIFGAGYNPLGIGWAQNVSTYGNFIYLHATANRLRWLEYDRLSGVGGIRFSRTMGDVNTMNLSDNTVICKVWQKSALARGIWLGSADGQTGTVVSGNTVKVEALTDDLYEGPHFQSSVTCIDINGAEPANAGNVPTMFFNDNTLITNVKFITFGSSYGSGYNNAVFNRTRLEKIPRYTANYMPFTLGYWYFNSTNSVMLNTAAGEGVDLAANPVFQGSGNSAEAAGMGHEGKCDLSFGNTQRLRFTDQKNNPLKNRAITVKVSGEFTNYRKDGSELSLEDAREPFAQEYTLTAVTDGDGYAEIDLIAVYHYSDSSRTAQRVDYKAAEFTMKYMRGAAPRRPLSALLGDPVVVIETDGSTDATNALARTLFLIAFGILAAAAVIGVIAADRKQAKK